MELVGIFYCGRLNFSVYIFTDYIFCTWQTGPKGVIADWQRYKQLEAEKRLEQDQELLALQKKLSITCRSHVSV